MRPPTRLAFYAARLMRRDGVARMMSSPQTELFEEIDGKSVALIGNARALAEADHGAQIDERDIVIRMNRAPMPDTASHGTRTDWLALATSLTRREARRIGARRIIWMSPKRKRLPWHVASSAGFYLHQMTAYDSLKRRLGAPPSTGLMTIDLLARSPAASVSLFGFDFFASKSLTGSREASQVPHDFSAEGDFVGELLSRDDRFTLIPL